ncbi:16S rRNA (uracil(1498)-N(3))-methyltransferase [Hydrogenophaga sp.]|uniref:16S rRNA (uracil(1498)-N(3))-methyltransferase n=1 Tax=Hydrogenophaga sp. TaxID=1904254 RepID=UPI0027317B6C|nr:16S rRNA (uracil(1498)-N(3))-methyltransferase [Hydrogenophaga sp.]MDP2017655.1 16S rRNA (uracil(1498)-N(3))-methyltransferase [Hydrogenophaga sp.]MDP3165739.1 16S rRNA (uracil(1498)-N(3))-methyltransferase [Hydrogenophaga sp.]MDP3809505.1 16S rRNA (uracil(1498)-N(3))-methyltransferase [Hydrogenophaga sp.]
MPRFHCPAPLLAGQSMALPASAARHVQVLRLQPGQTITLFNGEGGEWEATITRMGRSDVDVTVGAHTAAEREPGRAVLLAMGMPANDRMDWLVEKAAELGASTLQPLHTAHSVLRLSGERATKKQVHWQSVAIAACEQCGGNRVPPVQPVADFAAWLKGLPPLDAATPVLRCLLSLADGTQPLAQALHQVAHDTPVWFLSGPEGGLSPAEDALARAAGFVPVTLGLRVLRAETAALAALTLALA